MIKVIYNYWFVQFDFPDENGNPYKSSGGKMVYNAELKREIPKDWVSTDLSNLCTKIGDGIHGTPEYVEYSQFKFINGNNLRNGFIDITADTRCISFQEYQKYYIELTDNTILLSINGTIGSLASYVGEKVILGKSSAYINCVHPYKGYCYHYLQMKHIQNTLWNIATGSTIKNLSLDSIKKIKIPAPKFEILKKFNESYATTYSKKVNIFKQNQELVQLRDWLLPMLMNGQVIVK